MKRVPVFLLLLSVMHGSLAAGADVDAAAEVVAEGGSQAVSRFELGKRYYRGEGCGIDKEKAAALIRAAAEDGLPEAQGWYGFLLCRGEGVARDEEAALAWLEKAAAAGVASAQFNLGVMLVKGTGGKKEVDRGVKLVEEAAAAGQVEARPASPNGIISARRASRRIPPGRLSGPDRRPRAAMRGLRISTARCLNGPRACLSIESGRCIGTERPPSRGMRRRRPVSGASTRAVSSASATWSRPTTGSGRAPSKMSGPESIFSRTWFPDDGGRAEGGAGEDRNGGALRCRRPIIGGHRPGSGDSRTGGFPATGIFMAANAAGTAPGSIAAAAIQSRRRHGPGTLRNHESITEAPFTGAEARSGMWQVKFCCEILPVPLENLIFQLALNNPEII